MKCPRTFDPSSSSSSSSGATVVEPNGRLGTVVRNRGDCVALAIPTARRRRDGLEKIDNNRKKQLPKTLDPHCYQLITDKCVCFICINFLQNNRCVKWGPVRTLTF